MFLWGSRSVMGLIIATQIVTEQEKKSLIDSNHSKQMMVNQIEGLVIVFKNKANDVIIVEVKQQVVNKRNRCRLSREGFPQTRLEMV